jgi:uncharacterized membrane protein YeaQ/YmgE (transglycosylase-associated protein family)
VLLSVVSDYGCRPANLARAKERQMGIISWILLGLIAGFIGSKIVNKSGAGMLTDLILGVVGAVIGGLIFSFFGATGITGLNLWSVLVAVIGSVVVLWIYHQLSGRRSF